MFENYKVGEWVVCTTFHNVPMADGTFEPKFYSHEGQILSIDDDGVNVTYEVWGPGGEQSVSVGIECLKKKATKS